MTCPHEYHEMDTASAADGLCPLCLSAKLTGVHDLLRIIARGVEIGQSGRVRHFSLGDVMTLARDYCDAHGLSYARSDLRVVERAGFLKVGERA